MPVTSGTSNVACAAWQDLALGSGTGSADYGECGPDTVAISTNAVTGPGATSDNQHIVYHELCGNGEIIAKVAGITNSGYAGLFVRESSAAGARKGAIMTQKGSQVFRQIRLTTDGITAQASYMASGHQWLKLTRSGTQVMGSWSANGSTWNMAFLTSLSMTDCVVMGMFAYSGNSNTTITATFTDISIVQSDSIPATEVVFADSSLMAESGDTVEICVELENPCYCSPLSVDVALASDSLPHLAGFAPQTLSFEPGDTVQCFSVVLGTADTSGTYTFELTNISGGYESEVGEFEALTLVVEAGEEQGVVGYCGSFTKDSVAMEPGVSYFFDRFGNVYELEELLLPESSSRTTECGCEEFTEQDIPGISSSYFNLVFEDCVQELNGGFNDATYGTARRKIACKVFAGLSQLITPSENPCEGEDPPSVNIRFVEYTDATIINYQNGNVLASGTPFFDSHVVGQGGILDGLPWRVINNGKYTHFEDTDMFHGAVRVDFTKAFYLGDNTPVPATEYDLYSVLLHESLHVLGFLSLITPVSGNPVPPASISYSRYDLFLKKQITNDNIIIRDMTDPFRWDLNIPASELHSTCQNMASGDMVFAPPATVSTDSLRVYTGNANDSFASLLGSSFNHIYADCSPSATSAYLMDPGIFTGVRKEIGEEERVILCAIGYQIADMENCPCVATGDHDVQAGCNGAAFEIDLCDGDTLDITLASLLDNDQPSQSIGYLTSVTPNANTVEDLQNGTIRFIPCAPGEHLLKYIPMKEDCQEGSTVLISIQVTRCIEDCSFFSTEEPVNAGYNNNPCNLICNPEVYIQENSPNNYISSIEFNIGGYCYDLPGWYAATGTPDYVEQTQIQGPFSQTIDVAATVFPNSGSMQMQTRSSAESTFTPLSAGQGGYFFSYYAAGRLHELSASSESNLTMHPRLVDQAIMDQFIRTNAGPQGVDGINLNAGESLALINSQFTINKTSLTFHRSLSCFEVEPGESYAGLWFYPDTLSAMNRGFSFIDQVELLPDDFTAGEDLRVYDCDTTALGGVDFCMLSDVPVRYTWKDEQDNVLLSYEVEREYDGTFKVDGQANSSIPYLVVSPNATTTYTLVREIIGNEFPDFADCFTAEDDIVVEVMESSPPDAGFSALTFCLFASFTSNPTEGEHDWDFGGAGALTGTEDMPVFEYEQGGTYQVIHTVTNVCGQIDADTIAVTVEDCAFSDLECECEVAFVLDAEAFNPPQSSMNLSFFTDVINLLPDDFLTDACVIIRGQLIVDEDYEINESEVLMEEGAEIVVAPHSRFSLSGMNATQKVHGCENMWKGITVQTDGHFIAKQAWIEDARYAVRPLDKSRVDISSSTFIDNYVGLYFEGPYVFEMDPFYGNTFATDDDLLPAYAGQTPAPGLRSFAGIEVTDRYNLLHIGVAGAPENVFENLRSGIVTRNTPLFVERSRFLGMEITSSEPTYPFTGIGIRHEGGAAHPLTVLGFGASGQTAFENCTTGIWAKGVNATIATNRIEETVVGIHLETCQQRVLKIESNEIHASGVGIDLFQNDPTAQLIIAGNEISISEGITLGNATGIVANESGILHQDVQVFDTEINTYGWYDQGIRLNNVAGYHVLNNTVTMNEAPAYIGINVLKGYSNWLYGNTVNGEGEGFGINVNAGADIRLECNTVQGLGYGLNMVGSNSDADIATTLFRIPLRYGLRYTNNLMAPIQNGRGNRWEGDEEDYSGAGAVHESNNTVIIVQTAHRIFEPYDGSSNFNTYPPSIAFPNSPTTLPGDWFPLDGFPKIVCSSQPQLTDGEEHLRLARLIAQDSVSYLPGGTVWDAEWELYRKLLQTPALMNEDSILSDFFGKTALSTLGQLVEIESGKVGIFVPTQRSEAIAFFSAAMDSVIQAVGMLDSAIVADSLVVISAERQVLFDQSRYLSDTLLQLSALEDSLRLLQIETLAAHNEAIVVTNSRQANQRAVNKLYLEMLAGGVDFSQNEKDTLQSIAIQCPEEGGRAVFAARAMQAYYLSASYPETESCADSIQTSAMQPVNSATPKEAQKNQSEALGKVKIYPNPAGHYFIISDEPHLSGQLEIQDLYGRTRKTKQLSEQVWERIITTDLESGIYIITVTLTDGARLNIRLLIAK